MSPASGNLDAHRATMRSRILVAVRELALTRGVDKVSFADVAAQAGLARSVVYHYFPDKRALLIAHAEDETTRFMDAFTAALSGTASATERLRLYVRMQLTDFVEHPQPAGPELAVLLGPDGYERMHAHVRPLATLLTEIVAEGMASGEFATGDPGAAAALVHGCLGAERHPLGQGHHDLAATIGRVTAFVLRGMGADENASPRLE
ncbi:MAG: TetR family transcriptional regulator [Streptosporangiales bacterium]|nr:TetR family transcriptional regulator [Streptosporangiales bacterium]